MINKRSVIRFRYALPNIAEGLMPKFFSATEPLPINIRITKHGGISARINTLNKILMFTTRYIPLNVRYISFGTYSNMTSKVFFDCKTNIFENRVKRPPSALIKHTKACK